MSAAIVHYVKHWDNNTKGTVELSEAISLAQAIEIVDRDLTHEAHQALVDGEWDLLKLHAKAPFIIIKAELVDSVQAYAGHVSSL